MVRTDYIFTLSNLSRFSSFRQFVSETKKNLDVVHQTASSRYSNLISQQLYKLRAVNTHLRNAFNGMDVEWSDQGNYSQKQAIKMNINITLSYLDDSYYESGSGSGSGLVEDDEYGSGIGETDTSIPRLPESPKVNTRDEVIHGDYTESPKFQPDSTNINSIRPSTDSIPSSVPSSKMTPLKAAVVYLLPIFIAWFGGLFSDLL